MAKFTNNMYSITNFGFTKLNNAEFTGFFLNVQSAISKATVASLGIDSTVNTNYNATLQKLVDQVYTNYGSEMTAKMQALDDKRDRIYRRIRLHLEAVDCAEDGSALLDFKDIVDTLLINKYTSKVVSMPYNEETAILNGFILDLQDKLTTEQLSTLGITDDVTALETANEEFIEAYNDRSKERAAGDTQLTQRLREELSGYYQLITYSIQFNANSLNTGEDADEISATCQNFISLLNVLLADLKHRYNVRTGKESDEEESETESDDTKTETEEESEEKKDDGPTVIE